MRSEFDNVIQTTMILIEQINKDKQLSADGIMTAILPSIYYALKLMPNTELFRRAADAGVDKCLTLPTHPSQRPPTIYTNVLVHAMCFIGKESLRRHGVNHIFDTHSLQEQALKITL